MIDIHTHILPGIDDGARDLSDTLAMAEMAVDSGVTDMIATPHFNIPRGFENYVDDEYWQVFELARDAILQSGIPLQIYPGMEVYTIDEVPELLKKGKLMTLNRSRYLLMEFDFFGDPSYADDMLQRTAAEGIVPVIAHIERYAFVQQIPEIAQTWKDRGYVIQCNKGSFQGRFGRDERRLAYYLMDRQLVDVIASDTHRPYRRTPNMWEVYDQLAMDYPESWLEDLFENNPRCILENKTIITE